MTAEKGAPSRKRAGRPSAYSDAIARKICERIASGESLRRICQDKAMPASSTVYKWMDENEGFRSKCARAREQQAEAIFDEMAALEEKVLNDEVSPLAARVVLASRQWRASKLAPKKYGDKLEIENNVTIKPVPSFAEMYATDLKPGAS